MHFTHKAVRRSLQQSRVGCNNNGELKEGGAQVGGVPVVQDYADFADVDSFQQRLDYHYIVSTGVLAGRYYIGVYNNDAYFKVRTRGAVPGAARKLELHDLDMTQGANQNGHFRLRVDYQAELHVRKCKVPA